MSLTDFQKISLQEVENILRSTPNLECGDFQEVVGKRETYLKATAKAPRQVVEIYIYEDEAGYLLEGGEWTIFEKPDYSSSGELIETFLASLREKLA
jgi:hypothetical protein